MEQQEGKKKKVYTKHITQLNSFSSLPIDLTSEILLKLPEKSVVRFRCVPKRWSSISTDPYFINLFKARSPRLLLCFHAKNKLFVSSVPQHHHQIFEISNKSYSSSRPVDRYHMEFPIHFSIPPTESVQGLICFQKLRTLIVWNPSTRQLLPLPKPSMNWNDVMILLGYDPVESKHKVMCFPFSGSSDECRVLTLRSAQESWRTVKTNLNLRSGYHFSAGRCIKGVVYYVSCNYLMDVWVLISFDVRSEKFDKIQLPPSDVHKHDLIAYQGRLACIDTKPNMNNGIRLWILEDAEKHKWSSKDFVAPFDHHNKSFGTYFLLKGITYTGEFIYVVHKFHKPSSILFCNPVRNSFKRFEFKGITDDESVLSYLDHYSFHVLPNHVESRVSL